MAAAQPSVAEEYIAFTQQRVIERLRDVFTDLNHKQPMDKQLLDIARELGQPMPDINEMLFEDVLGLLVRNYAGAAMNNARSAVRNIHGEEEPLAKANHVQAVLVDEEVLVEDESLVEQEVVPDVAVNLAAAVVNNFGRKRFANQPYDVKKKPDTRSSDIKHEPFMVSFNERVEELLEQKSFGELQTFVTTFKTYKEHGYRMSHLSYALFSLVNRTLSLGNKLDSAHRETLLNRLFGKDPDPLYNEVLFNARISDLKKK
jgi:hypothetical protein